MLASVAVIVYNYAVEPFLNELYSDIACGILGMTLTYEFIYYIALKNEKKSIYLEQKIKLWNNISYRVKDAGETSFNEMPIGIILFDDDFVIEWNNQYAQTIFQSKSLNGKSLEFLDKDLLNFSARGKMP